MKEKSKIIRAWKKIESGKIMKDHTCKNNKARDDKKEEEGKNIKQSGGSTPSGESSSYGGMSPSPIVISASR